MRVEGRAAGSPARAHHPKEKVVLILPPVSRPGGDAERSAETPGGCSGRVFASPQGGRRAAEAAWLEKRRASPTRRPDSGRPDATRTALENPRARLACASGRTDNRSRSPR